MAKLRILVVEDESIPSGLEPGILFLQKPFSPQTLAHKVREVLDNGKN